MSNTLMSVQVIPKAPEGEHPYDYVDMAIEMIAASGLKYEVHALETTIEGELSEVFTLVEKLNTKLTARGAVSVMLQIKTAYHPTGITTDELVGKYR